MKYLRYYENNKKDIDPFDEEDWNEVEPDYSFLSWLKINYPNESKWNEIYKIDCCNNNINSLKGIENLRNLEELYCFNNNIDSLKGIKNLTKLEKLYCLNNDIYSLKGIENLTENLTKLEYCYNNNFSNDYINYIKSFCKEKKIYLEI